MKNTLSGLFSRAFGPDELPFQDKTPICVDYGRALRIRQMFFSTESTGFPAQITGLKNH